MINLYAFAPLWGWSISAPKLGAFCARHEPHCPPLSPRRAGHLTEKGRLYGRPNGTPAVTV